MNGTRQWQKKYSDKSLNEGEFEITYVHDHSVAAPHIVKQDNTFKLMSNVVNGHVELLKFVSWQLLKTNLSLSKWHISVIFSIKIIPSWFDMKSPPLTWLIALIYAQTHMLLLDTTCFPSQALMCPIMQAGPVGSFVCYEGNTACLSLRLRDCCWYSPVSGQNFSFMLISLTRGGDI